MTVGKGRRTAICRTALAALGALLSWTSESQAELREVEVIARESGVILSLADVVNAIDNPFINGQGQIGFTGSLQSGGRFVWLGDDIVWTEADDPGNNFGWTTSISMGIGANGEWVHRPLFNDPDINALYTHLGPLLQETDPAPTFAPPAVVNFILHPLMDDNGGIWFIGLIDTDNDSFSDADILYFTPDFTTTNMVRVLEPGMDLGSGVVLTATGIDTTMNISNDGSHYIIRVGPTSALRSVVVDGSVVMKRNDPDGIEGNWDEFDFFSVNNAGNYLVAGDTTAPSIRNEFIAYNGAIQIREEDTVDGVQLLNPATNLGVAISDNGNAAYIIRHNPGSLESVFFACDASNLAATSKLIIQEDDEVDIDGDGMADATVDRINMTNDDIWIQTTNDFHVVVSADLDFPSENDREAVLRIPVTCCGDGNVDQNEQCDDMGESATCNLDCTDAACGDGKTNVSAGEDCDDSGESGTCNGDCTTAMCGDGKINATALEDCDDSGESVTCNEDCTTAACGDMKINATAGEDCDNGGTETAICDTDCTIPICGDGVLNTSAGETCDDGGESDTCNADCSAVSCGDGVVNGSAGEDCDDSGESAGCDADCTYVECGDGVVNGAAGEHCDESGESATCDMDCSAPECGDGVLNRAFGEECEDGNNDDGDGCSSTCQTETLGQGGTGGTPTGGAAGDGGLGGTAGEPAGGTAGEAGSSQGGAGNAAGTAGEAGTAGTAGTAAQAPAATNSSGGDDGGCGCTTAGSQNRGAPAGALLLGLGLLAARRRRR